MKIKVFTRTLSIIIAIVLIGNTYAINVTPTNPACVLEVSFSGDSYTHLTSDDGSAYPIPQWKKEGGECDGALVNRSVSYKKDTKPTIAAKLKIPGCPNFALVTIWAVGTDGVSLPRKTVPVIDECAEYPATIADKKWPDTIKFYDRSVDAEAYKLKWHVEANQQSYIIETTVHQVYITMIKPTLNVNREALFYLACHKASGDPGANKAVVRAKIYEEFSDREVQRINPESGDPETINLRYWGTTPFVTLPLPPPVPKPHMLVVGYGKCGEWSRFLKEVFSVHGISSSVMLVSPLASGFTANGNFVASEFILKTVAIAGGRGSDAVPVRTVGTPDDQGHTLAAQKIWSGHAILLGGNVYFDPSYGKGPFATLSAWENGSIDGFAGTVPEFGIFGKKIDWFIRQDAGKLETKVKPAPLPAP